MDVITTTAAVEVPAESLTPATPTGPSWFVELIDRLKAVLAKLLLKFGIKTGLV